MSVCGCKEYGTVIYLRAPKSRRVASLICCMEPKCKKRVMKKKLKSEIRDQSINQPDFIYLVALRLDKMTMTYK